MMNGILLALFAYANFSWADSFIKAVGGSLSVFEISFFVTLISGVAMLLKRPSGERRRDFWKMKRPWLVQIRAINGVCASLLSIYAFTTIPLAEAYALVFLSPLFVTILSIIFLREHVGVWRWAAVIAGFLGVMLVVKPGFQAVHLGHVAAVGVALFMSSTIILLRKLSSTEKRVSMLGTLTVYNVAFNGLAILLTGQFQAPTHTEYGLLLGAGLATAVGQSLLLAATRLAPASTIASTNYSQIAWAAVIGTLFFNEYPDWLSIVGLAVVGAAGLLTLVRERFLLIGTSIVRREGF